jgi:pyrroloquinoline quinone biosynthesis protein B
LLRFKLLGTAAGGGFPQWNCTCSLCERARLDPKTVPPRLHLQALVSSSTSEQFLINASPDLKSQVEAEPALRPAPGRGIRNTPIAGIVLTSADLDQCLGLLLLREFQPLRVYSTALVRQALETNSFFRMLHRVPNQLTWIEITPHRPFALGDSIRCTPISLPASLPFYASDLAPSDPGSIASQASIGLVFEADSESGSRRIAYTPSVPEIPASLLALYDSCDLILVDGTFWSDDELSRTQPGTPRARDIGHVPIGGENGTLVRLRHLTRPTKLFVHINNTNPVLDPRSPEHRMVKDAGWQIAYDGWQSN